MCTQNFISMHIAKYSASGNVTQIKNVKTIINLHKNGALIKARYEVSVHNNFL